MDENDLQHLPCEGDRKDVLKFKRCESKKLISLTAEVFGVLQSFLRYVVTNLTASKIKS